MFPKKSAQLQKRYLRRCLTKGDEVTVKEWVTQVLNLNEYLKVFPTVNGVSQQALNDTEVMEILEYGVLTTYRREFTVQGLKPLTQGLKKFIDFCSRLEYCELTMEQPIPKKVSFPDETVIPKRKRKRSKIKKQVSGIRMQYCKLHGENNLHSTLECFELNRRKKKG